MDNNIQGEVPGRNSAIVTAGIFILLGLELALFYYANSLPGVLIGAIAFACTAIYRLDLALLWAIASAPFYVREAADPFQPKSFDWLHLTLFGRSFSGSGESFSIGELA